ncbi:MAG: Na(+)/H(+) antiporter subunit D, partial [Rickettsiales bacterium]|nr:Na(+)/H(+) antiporter subunit D [Rickettsiales bacterium]
PLYVHKFSHIFATVFSIAVFAGGLFALNQNRSKELSAAFLYAGSAIGVLFSGDFITMFIFWELMAIGSTFVIFSGKSEASEAAGMRYAVIHFFGGVILLIGIVAHLESGGLQMLQNFTLQSRAFETWAVADLAPWIILAGVLINAATPPFSSWLPDAYPESSVTGMVFLSAFTTKTSVFILILLFPGNSILIYLGLFMVFYGIIYAILENNMRRILAFSIINQVGFMITGIGIGSKLALNGAAAHAFCHIIYKALLLMSAGSVIYMTGKHKCSELGGLFRTMKVTMICGIIGALAISAFPFTSGFISKSMISSAAHSERFQIVWYLLAAASAGVFLHAGIKFPWFVFFQKDSRMRPKDPPFNMQAAMIFFSVLCIVPGFFPQTVYFMLPDVIDYDAYAHGHTITQLQLLLFAGLSFFLMLPMMKRTLTISLDFDWFYRVFGFYVVRILDHFVFFIKELVTSKMSNAISGLVQYSYDLYRTPNSFINKAQPIGTSALWTIVILLVYLAVYQFINNYETLLKLM